MRKIILLILGCILTLCAEGQDLINTRATIILKLLRINHDDKAFALSQTSVYVKGKEYSLGNGYVFFNTAMMTLDSCKLKKIEKVSDKYDVYQTKLFRDSVKFDTIGYEHNYGGETFVMGESSDKKSLDTLIIAYKIKATFIVYDSVNGRKIIFRKLHCYGDRDEVSYPIYTPLNIKKFYRLNSKEAKKLSLSRVKIGQYYFRDCD